MKRIYKVLCFTVMFLAGVSVHAQDGAYTGYTPYSIFGIGDLTPQGSTYNKGMGGVGIATRNKRYLNYMNPAAVTARDSLSFMADMSLSQNNKIFSQGDLKSAHNTFNVHDIALSFPVYRSSAMMFGLTPYSSTGYNYSSLIDDPVIIENTGNAAFNSGGQGNVYKLFGAAGVTFWKRLSLGAEFDGYFGNISRGSTFRFSKNTVSGIQSGQEVIIRGASGKFGIQYEQPIGKNGILGIGATYTLGNKLHGYVDDYNIAVGSTQVDTLRFTRDTLSGRTSPVSIPSEIGIGISYNHSDDWRLEFDYTRSDWTRSGFDDTRGFAIKGNSVFSTKVAEAYRAGFEIIPNKNDIRYYHKRIAYRTGVYYEKSYYALDGNQVVDYGLTLGASLPVFRYYNAVNLSVDLGQRASLAGNMIRERFINFTFGFNFFDYWFIKPRYD